MHELKEKVKKWMKTMGIHIEVPIHNLVNVIDTIEKIKQDFLKVSQIQEQMQHINLELEQIQKRIDALFVKANVSNEETFRKKSEQNTLYEETKKQIKFIQSQISEMASNQLLQETNVCEDFGAIIEELEKNFEENMTREHELHKNLAEAKAKMQQIEEGTSFQDTVYELEAKKGHIKDLSKRWASVVLARDLIAKTKAVYHKEKLPQTFIIAEKYFSFLTEGEYTKLFAPKSNQVVVERNDGQRFNADELSRGTAEQLYLSLRLALAEVFSGKKVPLILDDPFVNFDEKRTRRAMTLISEIGKQRQILFFTCHNHVVSMVKELGTNIINIAEV
jgi:uncharacterized protein YhaN